ncbi:MAG: transposon-transfer assisting family protein [Candidatus Ornithomonoglobus sp.]
MTLTPEEELLLAAYDESDREELIRELKLAKPYIDDEDMTDIVCSLIIKFENTTDTEFTESLQIMG